VACVGSLAPTVAQIASGTAHYLLVVPVEGRAVVNFDGARTVLTPDAPRVFAREGTGEIRWGAGARGAMITMPRGATQAYASATLGDARRIARASFPFAMPKEGKFRGLIEGLAAGGMVDGATGALVIEALVDLLVDQHGPDGTFPKSRSVSLAKAQLDQGAAMRWSLDALARKAGVTPVTLQRGFRDCIGTTVAGYAQIVRLRETRARLTSIYETRSIAAIAEAFGFASVISFNRAYEKTFGETPTKTRSEWVKKSNEIHNSET
jgi:AraC-like DNA-binding protein